MKVYENKEEQRLVEEEKRAEKEREATARRGPKRRDLINDRRTFK